MQRAHRVHRHEVCHDLERELSRQMLPEPRILACEGDVAVEFGDGGEDGDDGALESRSVAERRLNGRWKNLQRKSVE